MRVSRRILAGAAGFILLGGSFAERAVAQSAPETTGPYKILMEMDPSLAEHTVYRPEQVGSVKGKLPVVAYGNGACANAGNAFENYLAEVASYGFLVVANGPINPAAPGRPPKPGQPFPPFPAPPKGETSATARGGRGLFQQSKTSQLFDTMDWAKVQNGKDGSPYKGKLDVASIAVMGQSCGGLQALEAAGDPRVKTAVILNSGIIRNTVPLPDGEVPAKGAPMRVPVAGLVLPGSPETLKKLHTPIIYVIGGESDIAFQNAEQDFSEIGVPIFKANMDTGHNGTYWQPHGGKFAEVATQWLLWQLKGDKKASAMFTGEQCGLCKAPEWKVARKNWK